MDLNKIKGGFIFTDISCIRHDLSENELVSNSYQGSSYLRDFSLQEMI